MKKYLEFNEKAKLVGSIVEACVEDGKLDVMQKELSKVIYITLYYDGEDKFIVDEDGDILASETYDVLMKDNMFYTLIQNKIPTSEYRSIERLMNESIEEKIRQENTIMGILRKMSSLDIEKTLEDFKQLDMNKLSEITKVASMNSTSTI